MYRGDIPEVADCVEGRVYKLRCRNLSYGVWSSNNGGFIGIREKFGSRFLDTEYHWDVSEYHGTVAEAIDTGIDVPEGIDILARYPYSLDSNTGRKVKFDKPVSEGGKGWYYVDTGEADQNIRPHGVANQKLFDFLESLNDYPRS